MNKVKKLETLKIKLYLFELNLKEDKSYSLKATENDDSLVFVFQSKDALCRFLMDKNIDTSSSRINDIITHDLIMKEFVDGTVIVPKTLCQYLCNEAIKRVDKNLKHSKKLKNKVKYKLSVQH